MQLFDLAVIPWPGKDSPADPEAELPINLFVSGEWMAYRHDAPVAPQTTVRFGMTVAFPQWRPW